VRVAAATALSLSLALTACGNSEPGAGDSDKTIVIGAAIAQSGGYEVADNELVAGMKYKIDEINASGGIDGRKVTLITADHKTDVARVASATKEVLAEGADIVVPTADYTFAGPAALIANQQGKLFIGGAGAPEFGKKGLGDLSFNVYQATPTEAASMVAIAKSKGLKKAFLIKDTSIEYTKSICDLFGVAWKAAGGEVVGSETFKQDDPSVASQANAARRSAADFVVACSYPPGGANLVRQLRSAQVDAPIIGGVAFDGTYWLESLPDLSDFSFPSMAASSGDDPNPKINEFLNTVKPAGGALYALYGYEVVETIAKAVEKAGTTDGKALAKAIEGFRNVELLVGKTSYSANCHIPLGRPMAEQQIQGGKISYVGPVEPTDLPESPC